MSTFLLSAISSSVVSAAATAFERGGELVRDHACLLTVADDRVDVLQVLVVVEHLQAEHVDAGVRAEDQTDLDLVLLQRLLGQRATGVERGEAG